MSFTVNPVFSFRLNQTIVGQIKFGKFDGIHVCLTAATSTDKVIIHSPHKQIGSTNNRISWSDTNYDVALLNFNQEITAIATGCVSETDAKEILVIGSPTHVLGKYAPCVFLLTDRNNFVISMYSSYADKAYNVDDNTDLFYNTVREGVSNIIVGFFGSFDTPLVILGGNDSIRGYNRTGQEMFWIVTNGHVKSMALIDINKDGRNELVIGTHSGHILAYKDEKILMELTENTAVLNICQIEKTNLLAYTLIDGTLGVYDAGVRLWRIKSKNKTTSLDSFDLLGTRRHQLIVGWDSGKVDMRDYETGDVLFKLLFHPAILSMGQADYRGNGSSDLILCTGAGEVRGYERSKINLISMRPIDSEQLVTLLSTKKSLLAEISHYESNIKFNKERMNDDGRTLQLPANIGVIPANTRLQIAIYTNIENLENPNIEIKISTNNSTVIRTVLIFSDGIFASETFIAYPAERGMPRVVIPFVIPKDICYDINIKAKVGNEQSQQFHVFELTRQLPKFSMYAVLENFYKETKPPGFNVSEDFVSFKTNERFQRISLWINQNFLLSNDIESERYDEDRDFYLYMLSLHDRSHIQLTHSSENHEIRLNTSNIELAGNIIQSLAKFLNLNDLQTTAHFPQIEIRIVELFRKIDGYQATYGRTSVDLSQKVNQQKNLIIRIEDARLYNVDALMAMYTDLAKLTEDLVSTNTIRQRTFQEIHKSLDGINEMLKAASKLRVGSFAVDMMQSLKDVVKSKNINAINKIISTGNN